jgi:hypothetical protein
VLAPVGLTTGNPDATALGSNIVGLVEHLFRNQKRLWHSVLCEKSHLPRQSARRQSPMLTSDEQRRNPRRRWPFDLADDRSVKAPSTELSFLKAGVHSSVTITTTESEPFDARSSDSRP